MTSVVAFLYGVARGDQVTIAIVATLLLGITVLATLPPALRATTLDPMEALRAD